MSAQSIGIEFSETLSGGFILGARDPERGFIQGTLEHSELSIHCIIRMPDLARFISLPEHCAELEATVDFTPFGRAIPAHPGTFNLFMRAPSGHTKLMVYRFAFEFQGVGYVFEGKKFMRDGAPPTALWGETTRLYSILYRGSVDQVVAGQCSDIAGAGTLAIGVRGVADLLRSMRVLGARSALDSARARVRFAGFFVDELRDSYRGSHGARTAGRG